MVKSGKTTIKRLDTKRERNSKFNKRKKTILKKAEELSILSDVDVAVLMFSPDGKPFSFVSQNSDFSKIMETLSKYSAIELEEIRKSTVEKLKKSYVKSEVTVDPQSFIVDRLELLEFKKKQVEDLRETGDTKMKTLRQWTHPETVTDLPTLKAMEEQMLDSLGKLQLKQVAFQEGEIQKEEKIEEEKKEDALN